MDLKTYTFKYRLNGGKEFEDAVRASTKEDAYRSIVLDTRFKGCYVVKASFKLIRESELANT